MSETNPPSEASEPPIFAARLTPHRSLSPTGFLVVMLALVSCSFTAGLAFWMMGAWPIVFFFGLDIFLIQLAFRLNYRAARASEDVTVFHDRLTVTRTAPNGRSSSFTINPYWTRLEVERHPEIGVTGVNLTSHGKRFPLASFLGPHERESFATALSSALAKARSPAPI
ncbi:DUF2244 domain-containing protein [Bauldia sp.]|uniref:DUF2244 domain-containing protein n=1 Tax=Bauldia sp. TaxID=2575872 RepID=UPI003BA8FC01